MYDRTLHLVTASILASQLRDPDVSNLIPEPNLSRATELVLDLMKIPGASGGEQMVVDYIRQRLLQAGCDPKLLKSDQNTLTKVLDNREWW